jgi:hypothetical protein
MTCFLFLARKGSFALGKFSVFFLFLNLAMIAEAQWLDWADETSQRLVLSSVANSDPEEKDLWGADFNNDGWTDVVVVRKAPFSNQNTPPKTDLLLMNVNGVLTDLTAQFAPGFLSNPSFARDVFVGDFDKDGWQDIVIANTFGQQPMYYRNLGNVNGVWQGFADESATRFPFLDEDTTLFCAVWGGDVTGDGWDDLYFCNYKFNSAGGIAKDFLLINDGTGHFTNQSQARLGNLRNSAFGTAVQLVDIDNDGDLDILKVSTLYGVTPWNALGLFVLYNNGTGNFTNWQNLTPGGAPYMFDVTDFNLDGKKDIYVVDDNSDRLLILNTINPNTNLSFTTTNLNFPSTNGFGGNVHITDLDLDGYPDVIIADVDVDIPPCNSSRRLAMYKNNGSGALQDPYGNSPQPWAINSYDFWILDINKDGLPDFITGGCAGYKVFMSNNCELAPNNSDFDGDGLPDACDPCPANPDPNCTPPTDYPEADPTKSMARQWNELALGSIRKDFARPPVHARNLFHLSAVQWDAWAVYDPDACTYLLGQDLNGFNCAFDGLQIPGDIQAARDTAIAYASYRLLRHRFANSPQAALVHQGYDVHMGLLGYDINFTSTDYSNGSAAALGNYIAQCMIAYGLTDYSNEQNDYQNQYYQPVNPPMNVDVPGNTTIVDFNRWQPLTLALFIDQSGNLIPGETPQHLGPEWGNVFPFALKEEDKTMNYRDGNPYPVYHDPGTPPMLQMDGSGTSDQFIWSFMTTAIWTGHLDPTDGVMWDISPATMGNRNELPQTFAEHPQFYDQLNGGTVNNGHPVNPKTGQPYAPNIVPRGDYARVLAEFWADGPDSETPPGHWFSIFNYVTDHPEQEHKFMGQGDPLDGLEWDVKGYLALGGALHDVAVTAWGIKGWYDYVRPISVIRGMASLGQSSNPSGPNYHPVGLPIIPDYIEQIQTGDPLAGPGNVNVGKMKIKSWRGHKVINNVDSEFAGVGWILAEEWEPYQRPSFVTPPFAGYISGHSTYSRAAAEVLTYFTGDAYFPGGLGEFHAPANEFLVFEDGPSVDVVLQWATYRDAADESSASRIWGSIHPPIDDIPGRLIGIKIAEDAFAKALTHYQSNNCDYGLTCAAESISLSAACEFHSSTNSVKPVITVEFELSNNYCSVSEVCYKAAGDAEFTCIDLLAAGLSLGSGDSYSIEGLADAVQYEVYYTITFYGNSQSASAFITTADCSSQIAGCTNPFAQNYNPAATLDDGSCAFNCSVVPPPCVNTGSTAYFQVVGANPFCCNTAWDSVCQAAYDALSNTCAFGCIDPAACNYNPNAILSDGSCTYPGCTNPSACNYNPAAGCDNGSCLTQITWYLDLDGDGYGTNAQTVVAGCNGPCTDIYTININSTYWLDETSWTFRDASNTIILQGGPYANTGAGGNFTASVTSANGPFTFFIETQGTFNDNVPNWSVSTGGITLASGTMQGGTTFTQGDLNCSFASQGGDCNDNNAAINPGATENPCNGIDDNCNGTIDEGTPLWYADADGDGYGNPAQSLASCNQPCDGTFTINVNSGGWLDETTWTFRDASNTVIASGGPYGNGGNVTVNVASGNGPFSFFIETQGQFNDNTPNWSVTSGTGWLLASGTMQGGTTFTQNGINCIYIVSVGGDCNDNNPNINPGATEILCNGIDENCNGQADEGSIYGCMDPTACNFNPAATCSNGLCTYPGCTNAGACNYSPTAGCDNGSCIYPGCTNPTACNYNASAGCDNGSCVFPGCMDPAACNYNAAATCDANLCEYISCGGCINPNACNFNPLALVNDGSCTFPGCTTPAACNYDPTAGCDSGLCVYPGCRDSAACNYDPTAGCDNGNCTYPGCNNPSACNFNPAAGCSDGSCTFPGCTNPSACNYNADAGCDNGSCVIPPVNDQCLGAIALTVNGGAIAVSNVGSCVNAPNPTCGVATQMQDIWFSFLYTGGNITINASGGSIGQKRIAVYSSCGGTQLACNTGNNTNINLTCPTLQIGQTYVIQAGGNSGNTGTFNLNITSTAVNGCTDPAASNYNACANNNTGCIYPGCTDSAACNFDPGANQNDGSCNYPGCTNPAACNYNAAAGCDDGSCSFPGCTDAGACNYNPTAGCNDGSCNYTTCAGCTDSAACNYDASATIDNGSCTYPGCTAANACNYNAAAGCDDGSCDFTSCGDCPGDLNNDGIINFSDLSIMLTEYGCTGTCISDMNNDGQVNFSDLSILLSQYGLICP